jgi:DNA-binding transcriptional MerR regulator
MMDIQDDGQSNSERVSIPLAAKALKVSTKTVHRYIEKGQLSKIKEGTRVYVPMDEIRALLSGQPRVDKSPHVHEKDRVTVDRTHYDSLLVRLGQLEANQQLLLEYKEGLQIRDKELAQIKLDAEAKAKALIDKQAELEAREKELAEIRAELERARLPWYKKLFRSK